MNLASFLANKCFEYLLSCEPGKGVGSRIMSDLDASSSSRSSHPAILPPRVREPHLFHSNCDGCGVCLENCENGILVAGPKGYPQVDFSKGCCSFCGACAESCPRGLFSNEPSGNAWDLRASITGSCLAHNNVLCRTCAEHCEEEAIIIPRKNGTISAPLILAERCTGCGACYSPCPAKAIEIGECVGQEKLPAREETG